MTGKPFMNIPREKIPWYPTIDAQKCQNCGNCLDFCSHGVYDQGGQTVLVAHPFERDRLPFLPAALLERGDPFPLSGRADAGAATPSRPACR